MIVECAGPADVAEWFYNVDSRHELLCLLLCVREDDVTRAAELVQSLHRLDTSMGEKVALVLFAPFKMSAVALDTGKGRKVLGASVVLPPVTPQSGNFRPLRDELPGVQSLRVTHPIHGKEIAAVIAQQSISFAPDLLTELGVHSATLPALCVLSKTDSTPWLLELSREWDTDEIAKILGQLSAVAESQVYDPEIVLQDTARLRDQIDRLNRYASTIEDHRDAVLRHLEGLAWHYHGTDADRLAIALFFEGAVYTKSALEGLLARLSFGSAVDPNDRRVQSIISIGTDINNIETKLSEISEALSQDNSIRSILERRKRLREIRHAKLTEIAVETRWSVRYKNLRSTIPGPSQISNTIIRIGKVSHRIYNAVSWMGVLG